MSSGTGISRPARALLIGAAVVLLAAGSTVAVAAASGALPSRSMARTAGVAACEPPPLPGTVVAVRLVDMGLMMGGGRAGPGMMGGGMRDRVPGRGAPSDRAPWPGRSAALHQPVMSVIASRASVPAGEVSIRVRNAGLLTHELVILPLAPGATPGSRAVGADGRVDEAGSVGEASANCAAGSGDGISAGSASWVSLRLPPGRYELICNLPGHYAAGMYTELDAR